MFTAIKDNKIIAFNHTGDFPCLVYDEIKEMEDAELVEVGGEFVLSSDNKAVEKQKQQFRNIRNAYLSATDLYMITDYPITDEEREAYKAYRQYLRDYTLGEDWWESLPQTYDEWKEVK